MGIESDINGVYPDPQEV